MSETQTAVKLRSDEELIAAFQHGQIEAFNILVGRYKDQLINFVYRYLSDYDDTDDVVQETFVRVYRKKHLYKPVAKFSTWLYTIATNLAKTKLRQRKREAWFLLSRRGKESDEKDYEIPDVRYPADGQAESSLKREIIQKALNSISATYREVVVLCDIQEMTYEEICEITGLNIGTVKSRLNRGRAKLQELLKDLINE
ncbi:MAG: sigma-70 family RNA polymerase sigma factor [Ignavibacteriae bacterium]|nr:sigma-70 family RNA polymerase sigma factor [Ignavibacteriota bacterium]